MLTDNERETLAKALDRADDRWQHGIGSSGYDVNGLPYWLVDAPETLAAVEAIVAAREGVWRAPIEALAAEEPLCWISRTEGIRCTDFVGGTIGSGVFVEGLCCLPCRLRAALGSVSAPGNEAGQ